MIFSENSQRFTFPAWHRSPGVSDLLSHHLCVETTAPLPFYPISNTLAGSCGKFAPFEIKEHMVLAPRRRTTFHPDLCSQLDQLLQQQSSEFSFLKDLKGRPPLRSGPTQVSTRNADIFNSDVVIVERGKGDGIPERRKFGRMKLLQFCENHRPAYWGTWNKKTVLIRARDPWAQDTKLLDYEVDSDEEWEEEEPGESLSHSEGECADPENHKVRQKLKAKEWDEFLAKGKRFRILQPVKIGCVWAADRDCAGDDLKVLQQFAACFLETMPVQEQQTPKASKASKRESRDQQILAQLLPLLHGNVNGSKVIIREFQEHCRRGLLSKHTRQPPKPLRYLPAHHQRGHHHPLQVPAQAAHFRELSVREAARLQDVLVRAPAGSTELPAGAPARAMPVELRDLGALGPQRGQWQCPLHGTQPGHSHLTEEEVSGQHVHHPIHEEAQARRPGWG
ncbi:hypothetical protein H8959_017226 [Pygathrix nigripes]